MFNFFKKKHEPKTLFYHTDVHCHLLPGVDHGSPDIETSLHLLNREMDMGINHIIATSHVTKNTFENTPETLRPAYDKLQEAVKNAGMDMKIDLSAEYRIDDFSMAQFKNNIFLLFPNRHILLENAFQQEILGMDELMFDMQLKDITPILAHPERYDYYARKKSRYTTLHNAGVLFQINILSFTGYFGEGAKQTAHWLLEHDYIDFLGSDMHNESHADIIHDFIGTKEYRKLAERLSDRIMNDTEFE